MNSRRCMYIRFLFFLQLILFMSSRPEPILVKPEPEDENFAVEIKPEPDWREDPDGYASDRTERADENRSPVDGNDSDKTENLYDDPNQEQEHPFQDEGRHEEQTPAPPWGKLPMPKRERGRTGKAGPRRPRAEQDTIVGRKHKIDPLSDARVPKWSVEPDSEPPKKKAAAPVKRGGPKAKKASQAQDNHSHLICARNYAAVDARRQTFGLIDQGLVDAGARTMVMHVRRGQPAWDILNAVKPGSFLEAKSKSGRGSPTQLRVRFTTPTKYYPPGCKFTTMTVGVDEMDWQSLMAKARHI